MKKYSLRKYSLRKYKPRDEIIWDDLVENSVNGTISHTQKFISYHPENRFEDCSLMFFKGEKLIAVFPAAIISKENKKILKSHPGTSYGGIVFRETPSLELCFNLFQILEDFAKVENFSSIEFRHSPKIFNKFPLDQIEFAMGHLGYIREAEELSTCYYLPDFVNFSNDEIISHFNLNNKRNLKYSLNSNLEFQWIDSENNFKLFYKILENNLKKHKTKPVHSLDEIKKLMKLFPERVKIAGAFLGDELLGGSLLFRVNKSSWHIFYSALDYEKSDYHPVHFLIFHLIKQFSKDNITWLNYGISTEDGGKIINYDLFRFKEGFAGRGIIRTYWAKEL
jgi:Acetyltransferase (GNAT) domain